MDLSPSPDQIFLDDPEVLFSHGNFIKFTTGSRSEIANTLARIIIYGSVVLAGAQNKPMVFVYAIVLLGLVAFIFYTNQPPMNTFYRKPTANLFVHDATKGQPRNQLVRKYKTDLLTNVRERNIYLGGVTGAQTPSDYMLGGTRPLAPNRTEELRNQQFFNNVNQQGWFENAVPTGDWFSKAGGQKLATAQ